MKKLWAWVWEVRKPLFAVLALDMRSARCEGAMKKLWAWVWEVRKPLFAVLALVVVAALAFAGKVEDAVALAVLVLAQENSSLGAKVEHHTSQLAQVVQDLAKAGVSVTVHNYGAAGKSVVQAAEDGVKLAESIQAEQQKTGNS